jgi:hypothetical protein
VDLATIPPNRLKLLLILEGLCRDKSYCYPTNETLARLYGLDAASGGFRRLVRDLEEAGWISRQLIEPGRPGAGRPGAGRLGIFLHRRLDHDLPVEDGPPPPADAVERLKQARSEGASKGATPMPQKGPAPLAQEGRQNKDGGEERQINDDTRTVVVVESPPLQDPELAPLVEKATERFGANYRRVEQAVEAYGREWVEQALERPGTEQWGGVLHTLKEYKAEGGPCAKATKKAPAAPPYDQWTLPNETARQKAERHQQTPGLWSPPPPAAVAAAPAGEGWCTAIWQAARGGRTPDPGAKKYLPV